MFLCLVVSISKLLGKSCRSMTAFPMHRLHDYGNLPVLTFPDKSFHCCDDPFSLCLLYYSFHRKKSFIRYDSCSFFILCYCVFLLITRLEILGTSVGRRSVRSSCLYRRISQFYLGFSIRFLFWDIVCLGLWLFRDEKFLCGVYESSLN